MGSGGTGGEAAGEGLAAAAAWMRQSPVSGAVVGLAGAMAPAGSAELPPIGALSDDLGWDDLDKAKLFGYSVVVFAALRAAVYPLFLLKTRLQAQQQQRAYSGVVSGVRAIVASEGVAGLYKGLLTMVAGVVPAQTLYVATYEGLRAPATLAPLLTLVGLDVHADAEAVQALRNGIGGLGAGLASLAAVVPIDVVSQRLQMQSKTLAGAVVGGSRSYSSGLAVVMDVLRNEGLRGLYRGTVATMLSTVPSSGIWWSSYTLIKPRAARAFGLEYDDIRLHVVAGTLAGVVATTSTNPLDVIRTRLQIDVSNYASAAGSGREGTRPQPSIASIARTLYQQESLASLWTKGLGPRLWTSSIMGILMVAAYERIKILARKLPVPDE
ncbi:solute carrier family 25 member 44 [Thecamonas trahens ATCC 50062]|uniref:Solute carrier family 25 member 44 n=1 Tax=Thecamonas trahens ATCC 50062 TaxID=461836 RepID=A0A0L0D9X9_THETB|nr:solute carrier family 25 member 44 [Thecamonas trahens ATCC 50062]KNC49167.1 solute carrier family 25 member 44 [Thecamonas trahens ATCC 50062]|eukprot:XP_013758188.1 solute carrier family 25 member 44 [Thecamonas trahens ATCC 50062]